MDNLSNYKELYHYDNKRSLVRDEMTGDIRMMKRLTDYDEEVYAYLISNRERHIPRIYEYFKDADNNLIVIEELIQGNTFDIAINDHSMSDDTKLQLFLELLEGLKFLHNAPKPIIHRDLKPSNIMITEKGEVKILDYDAAKIYKPNSLGDTTYLGTDGVAAPEQYGFMQSDSRSDVYAVGKMLISAFPDNKKIRVIANKATSFSPEDRYANAGELSDALAGKISPKLKIKPLFPPPGFRTRKWWKMMLAIPFYPFVIFLLIGFNGGDTSIINIVEILLLGLFIFVSIDICNSWTGIFDVLPFVTHRNIFLRYLFKFVFCVAAAVVLFFIAVCALAFIDKFIPVTN